MFYYVIIITVTPPTGPAVTYAYNSLDQLVKVTRGEGSAATETAMEYDLAGRKTKMSDADMGDWSYIYDTLGNLKTQTDARGCETNLTYDVLNRLTAKTYANCPTTAPVTYGYDAGTNGVGRRTSMSSGDISSSWTYDTRGRVKSETTMGYTTSYAYNSADLMTSMTYPDGETVFSTYNDRMLLESVGSMAGTYAKSINYDSAGRIKHLIRGNDVMDTAYNYNVWNTPNQGGRLQGLTTTRIGDQFNLQTLAYGYDPVGNIKTIADAGNANQKQCFQYDDLDRLTHATTYADSEQGCASQVGNGNYDESYGYDPDTGNLTSKAGLTLSYDTTHKHAVISAGGNSYAYDANGNQITRDINSGNLEGYYELSYDAENRLVEVKKDTTVIATFIYDGDGKQVKATINNVTTTYVNSNYEIEGEVVTKYYFAGATRIALRKDGILSYLLADHLGSSSLTTDSAGTVTAKMLYGTWGGTRFSNGSLNTKYEYTGQRSESGIGLHFYNARWYDDQIGRFTQPDSIIPESQGTQAYDRYVYVNNNPVNFNDPSGHMMDKGEIGDYTWEDQVHDARLSRAWKSYATDRWGVMAAGLRNETHLDIIGHGREVIKQDPAVRRVQYRLMIRIMADPRYQVEEFLARPSIGNDVQLGEYGIGSGMFNDSTWTQRDAKLDATSVIVHKDGSATISWSTRDTLDLTPDWGSKTRGFAYNAISTVAGSVWHEGLGASRTMTTSASWQTTAYPYCPYQER